MGRVVGYHEIAVGSSVRRFPCSCHVRRLVWEKCDRLSGPLLQYTIGFIQSLRITFLSQLMTGTKFIPPKFQTSAGTGHGGEFFNHFDGTSSRPITSARHK
jgi:hypothetical protein